jgi:hypothetical protein
MELLSDFATFLSEIRFTESQRTELRDGHNRLRKRLKDNNDLAAILVSDFLQGSYRRHTAVRPKNDSRADVDIIVVTKLHEDEYTPEKAMDLFEPFLKEHYSGKWRRQGRSLGIELSAVDFDLVITSAPSQTELGILQSESVMTDEDIVEAADWRLHRSWLSLSSRKGRSDAAVLLKEAKDQPEWQAQPLRIPDRDAGKWDVTHPLEQIRWTREKNKATEGCFVNVIKAIKWWRLVNYEVPKNPKSFPLERIIGDCCPDGIGSVAEGIVLTLEAIVSEYEVYDLDNGKPQLLDYGVPSQDVLGRLSVEDFGKFYEQAKEGAQLARRAYNSKDRTESGNLWKELLGSKFPTPPDNGGTKKSGYSTPSAAAVPGSGRFA